ncbi:catenin delta-1-like isoform X2 [Clavelina lepadiformis]|uniref:Catenin delta-1 n=2 Tax=Clavelina lepadiformis TaxID=159417 RepID=A0ABP0EYZ0_CLALP
MAAVDRRNLLHRDGSISSHSDEMPMEEDSAASILQSVREQEQQFAQLTKEIENERRTVADQLNNGKYNDMEYQETQSMDSDGYYDPPQGEYVTETYSRREDYSDPREETEVLIDEDGVSKTVTKRIVTKTVTERRVRQVDEEGSLPRNHSDKVLPRHGSERINSDHGSNYDSMRRNNHNGPYDETRGLLRRSSGSSSGSDGGRRPSGYSYSSPRDNFGSTDEVRKQAQPEKFQPEEYGLEDDRRSDYDDDNDQYGLEPAYHDARKQRSISSDEAPSRYDDQMDGDVPIAAPRSTSKPQIGRAPLAMQEAGSRGSLDRLGTNWHSPSLEEVIKMLSYNMPVVQENAAAYLQHLCYSDDKIKSDVRKLGGIPPLVKLLDHESPKVELNACGALRNLCYGSKNDKNKIEVKNCEGVPAVVRLIRSAKNSQIKELATGTLWNLSAHPELKGQVLELGLEPLTNLVIIPYADSISQDSKPKEIEMVDIFTNSVGVIRNLSSTDSSESRRRLRECNGLLYALMNVLQTNKDNGDIDNKGTENCMCVLRNLTFKLQEETPNARELYVLDKPHNASEDKSDTSCFGKSKSKDKSEDVQEQIPPDDPEAVGSALLWQPENSRLYVSLLQDCKRDEVAEAALGALQNLTHGDWKWALYARIVVRKEKGLPVVIDKLRTDNDQVVRVGTTALTNLAEDRKNKDLIGKFAMKDLVYKLPGGSDPNVRLSDITTIAVLNTVRILVDKSPENVRNLREAAGIERITTINNSRDNSRFHARVVKAAGQVLQAIWANKETHSLLKKDGWNKNHFTPTVTVATLPRNSKLNNKPYEEPRSAPSASSTGGRRAQRNASQTGEEVQMTPVSNVSDSSKRKGPADSWV